jgi:hypothetical protein
MHLMQLPSLLLSSSQVTIGSDLQHFHTHQLADITGPIHKHAKQYASTSWGARPWQDRKATTHIKPALRIQQEALHFVTSKVPIT